MCGITGLINPIEKDDIQKMTDAIRHRGPDDTGFFADEYLALGMRRLSIIDIAGGRQPLFSSDGRFLIFFNGEIYNYKELRAELLQAGQEFKTESDTEVVLRMFEVYGLNEFSRLRGMFAFAIYDREKTELILVRDFFGIKPLYYWAKDAKIAAFSSEIKSFIPLAEFNPEVNDAAVFNYLSFQYNPLEETFFKNVFKLPPAHYMKIDLKTGRVEMKKYWRFEFKQNDSLNESKIAKEIFAIMKDSVSHHMIADVAVGSFLSGGIDSSIIVSLMSRLVETNRGSSISETKSGQKIQTFTVGFESLSEGREALETALPLQTLHHEITISADEYFKVLPKVVWYFDEPVADPSALGLYFLAREAAKHVKVVLSGEGADELFGGYNIYLEPFARRWLTWIPNTILNFIINLPFDFRGKNYAKRASQHLEDWYIGNASIFKQDEIDKLWKTHLSKADLDTGLGQLYRRAKGLSDSTMMQFIDINTWLVGDILAKADKMTMAHSLELRVPFLDMEVARLAATLPDRFKWRDGSTKYLLREAFKKVLPESVRTRKKLGFPTPIRNWFTSERKDIYNTIIDNPYIQKHMNIAYIRNLIDNHTSRKVDNSRKIYLLLMLAIWYNVFIQPEKLS
ncbi:MAG: asparagine synthase (glutamine-hydrolyzing) [bacterium]|nr:asparagine synthase (glutamine-hydrolyzing) [bacterium]